MVLGSGAVGTVSALKFAQVAMVEQLVIADAVPARAEALASRISDPRVASLALDAGDKAALVRAIRETGTTILLNAALPATNLVVMRACLEAGCDYIDMASGGAANDGIPKLDDQFALDAEFRAAGRMALLGMGADPGTTNVYAAHAAKHLFDQVTHLQVRDGDNSICQGHSGFLAAFSPWVFIDECLCGAISWRDGRYHLEEALSGFEPFNFPELGTLNCYHVDHEESRTLPRFIPGVQVADFKLCMDDVTWQTLKVMKQLGISRTDKVRVGRCRGGAARPGRFAAAPAQGPGRPDAGQDLRRDSWPAASSTARNAPTTSTTWPTTRRSTPTWASRPRPTRPASRRCWPRC